MADKPDVSTAISAASSKMYHGGVVYTFPDGSTLELHGGGGISYRANSPGFHGEINQVERYGAIGVAESTKPNDKGKYPNVLVFATKAAADAGLAKKLNEIDSGFGTQHPTVADILEKYNGGGNPNYVSDFFNGFHHPDITAKTDYRRLTDEQKA